MGLPGLKCSASLLAGSEPQSSSGFTSIWPPHPTTPNKMYSKKLIFSPSTLEKDLENKSVMRRGEPRSKTSNRKLGEKTLKPEQSKSLPGLAVTRRRVPAPAAERPLHDPSAEHESPAPQTQLIVRFFFPLKCPWLRHTDFREKSEIKCWDSRRQNQQLTPAHTHF